MRFLYVSTVRSIFWICLWTGVLLALAGFENAGQAVWWCVVIIGIALYLARCEVRWRRSGHRG